MDSRGGKTERTKEGSQVAIPHGNHYSQLSTVADAAPALPALPSLSHKKQADPPACWTKFIQCVKTKLNLLTSLFLNGIQVTLLKRQYDYLTFCFKLDFDILIWL